MSTLVICPGIHDVQLTETVTQTLLAKLRQPSLSPESASSMNLLVVPTHRYPAYSGPHILAFLFDQFSHQLPRELPPLGFLSFSAGVVGAIGAAHLWQLAGGRVTQLIACDGWGVPLWGEFPIYRISHDAFTHWTTAGLERREGFYAEPAVAHLDLWRSLAHLEGWWLQPEQAPQRTNAIAVIRHWLAAPPPHATKLQ